MDLGVALEVCQTSLRHAEYPAAVSTMKRFLLTSPNQNQDKPYWKSRILVGDCHFRYDRFQEAVEVYAAALDQVQSLYGLEDPKAAAVLQKIATVYVTQFRYQEAELFFRRALQIKESVPEDSDSGACGAV